LRGKDLSEEQLRYAARDAEVLVRLRETMIPLLQNDGLFEAAKIEFDALFAFGQLESNGLFWDWEAVERRLTAIKKEKEDLENTFISDLETALKEAKKPPLPRNLFGGLEININSVKQLLPIFQQCVPIQSLDQKHLKKYQHPLVVTYLCWKTKETSQRDTTKYLQHRGKNGRVYASFRQLGAESGRTSCTRPNIQNLPREDGFRRLVIAPPGRAFVCADYSQMQLRITAELAKDGQMIQAYHAHGDLHQTTASLLMGVPFEMLKDYSIMHELLTELR